MLNEVKRLQQLAGILNENYDYENSYMDSEDTEFEPELDEMARTAGTGGELKITDKGRQAYKITRQKMASGERDDNMREMWFRILNWMIKNEGKRLTKIAFAREVLGPNVPQPRVNPFFNQLIEKGWVDYIPYEGYQGEKQKSSGGKDFMSRFTDELADFPDFD